jgi:DNA-binding NarL/FixJ family response regulator
VVMSADESNATIHRALELHATGFVPKSQKPDVLHAALQSALAGGVFLPASVIDEVRRGMLVAHAPHVPAQPSRAAAHAPVPAHTVGNADFGLTPREFETLRWLVRGLPTKSIASRMGLEDITVRKYVSQLLAHFNVRRRTELIVLLAESGTKLGAPPVSDPVADRC